MSQTINRDPEVKELKRKFGLTGFSIWLEVLAETDGSEGVWKGSETDIRRVLAGVCDSNTRGSARVLQWLAEQEWIVWQRGSEAGNRRDLKVVNYAKYHPARDAKQIPSADTKRISIVSPPSFPSDSFPKEEKKNTKSRFPKSFEIQDDLRLWAKENGFRSPDVLLAPFRDYHIAKDSRFLDWKAAFRTWIRNDTERFASKMPAKHNTRRLVD